MTFKISHSKDPHSLHQAQFGSMAPKRRDWSDVEEQIAELWQGAVFTRTTMATALDMMFQSEKRFESIKEAMKSLSELLRVECPG